MDHQHPCPPTEGLDFSAVSHGPVAAPPAYSLQLALQIVSQITSAQPCIAVLNAPKLWPQKTMILLACNQGAPQLLEESES